MSLPRTMTSISVISPMMDRESMPTMSTMIDTEESLSNIVDHANATRKLGTSGMVSCLSLSNFTCYIQVYEYLSTMTGVSIIYLSLKKAELRILKCLLTFPTCFMPSLHISFPLSRSSKHFISLTKTFYLLERDKTLSFVQHLSTLN